MEVPHQQSSDQRQRRSREQQAHSDPQLLPAARFLLQPLGVRGRQKLQGRIPVRVLKGTEEEEEERDVVKTLTKRFVRRFFGSICVGSAE